MAVNRGIKAADVTGDIPDAFWHGIFRAGSINTVAGPSGVGKSQITVKLAADESLHRNVIYCNAEDDRGIQRFRLEVAGANLDNVILADFMLPDDHYELAQMIALSGARVVIFDTAEKVMSTTIQRWGRPLNDLLHDVLEPTGCAAIFVHHTIRSVKADANWRAAVGGATNGLVGSSRAIALVGTRPDDEGQVVLCPVKDSYGELGKAIAWEMATTEVTLPNGDTAEVAHMQMVEKGIEIKNPTELVVVQGKGKDGKKGPSPEKAKEAADFLQATLKNGAMPLSDYNLCVKCGGFWSLGHGEAFGGTCPKYSQWDAGTKSWDCTKACGGALTVEEGVVSRAAAESVSMATVKRARPVLGIESSRKRVGQMPDGKGGTILPFIRLPDGHPSLVAGSRTELP